MISNRNRQRRDCTISKPVTPSILRQQRSAERLRRFDRAMICGYGLLASLLVLHLIFGSAMGLPTGGQQVASLHAAPHMIAASAPTTAPAKIVSVSWTQGISQSGQAGGI